MAGNADNKGSSAIAFNAPFEEQLAFFKKKLNLPTERWDDIIKSAHDRAFMVAGAQKADLLADLNKAVTKAIEQGTGLEAFRKDFKAIVAQHGWTGWTGEGSKAGIAWRTKVIYQTNMTTSYAAGRWQQLNDPELLKVLPYWQYKHSDSVAHPRPLHVSWDGLTLPPDDAFWKTHFPPNGWGCQCRVTAVGKSEAMRAMAKGRGPANAPAAGSVDGIDDGFAYAPGANVDMPLRQAVQDKLIKYPPAISKALSKDINRRVNAETPPAEFVRHAIDNPQVKDLLWMGFVEDPEQLTKILNQDVRGYMVTMNSDIARHVKKNHEHDGDGQRPPVPDDFNQIIHLVNSPDTLRMGDPAATGEQRIIAFKEIAGELFRAVFEVRTGKKNKSLNLFSFLIKT